MARTRSAVRIKSYLSTGGLQATEVAEGFDLALRIARLADSQLVARRLTSIRRVVAASPAWWEHHGLPEVPEDLAGHRLLAYANENQSGMEFSDAAGRSGTVRLRTVMRANNGEFLRDAAIAGLGVILQPTFLIHRAVEAGELRPVLTDCDWRDLDAWAVYPSARFLPQRVRALVDFLAARFSANPYWDDCLKAER